MKIAIVTDNFLPGIGGTEQAVKGLADELSKKHEVLVACPSYHEKNNAVYNFKVQRCRSIKLTKNEFLPVPAFSKKFRKAFKNFMPDIINCHSILGITMFAIKYAKKHRIPVLMTIHTKYKEAFFIKFRPIVSLFIKGIVNKLKKANNVSTVCRDMVVQLQSYGFNKHVSVIRNGSTLIQQNNLLQKAEDAVKFFNITKPHILLFVGHIVKFKNLQMILDALKIVRNKRDDFIMLFVGSGLNDRYFKKQCQKMKLNDIVTFTGVIKDRNLLSGIYAASDLLLFPSIFDNDPLTIVEAAIYETPAIVLSGTGSSERIIDGNNGFIIENDVTAFAEKINFLLNNKTLLQSVGAEASKTIPKSWEETAKEYENIYTNMLNDKRNIKGD